MKAFFKSKALLRNAIKLKEISHNHSWLIKNKDFNHANYGIVVFSHHRDVKVALDDLRNAGVSHDGIILIGRNARRYSWCPRLMIDSYFDPAKFDFNQIAKEFFWRLFQQGKYLALIAGDKYQVNSVSKIMGRRPGHSEVWYFKSL